VETCGARAANASYVTSSLPQGFGIAEPGQALLALAGALSLAVARIGRR
jgi:hypothetical protein